MMIDVTSSCPIMIYEIKNVKLLVVDLLCLFEAESEIDDVGASEQRWISN